MSTFTVGQSVKVSDRRPKPPQHHKKKLRGWESNHFDGVIKEVREDRNSVLVTKLGVMPIGIVECNFEISFDDPIIKVEPAKNDGE